jgi:predicted GNAT superfamily acetyltransferase
MNSRHMTPADFAEVLALNEESVEYLSPLSYSQLEDLHRQSAFSRVVDVDGRVIAFILALGQGADYDSVNYQWFEKRYAEFLYVDRVVVSLDAHGNGAGSILYRQLFEHASRRRIPLVACEFDVEPPTPASERFHAKFGFVEVGRQLVAGGRKTVSLQTAAAPSAGENEVNPSEPPPGQ